MQASNSIVLQLAPSDDSNTSAVDFDWSLKAFTEDYLSIKLDFDDPKEISVSDSDVL